MGSAVLGERRTEHGRWISVGEYLRRGEDGGGSSLGRCRPTGRSAGMVEPSSGAGSILTGCHAKQTAGGGAACAGRGAAPGQ